jgi:hypothetical protein
MLRTHTFAVGISLVVTLSALVPTLQAQVFPGGGPGMRGPGQGPGGMMGMGMGMGLGGGQGGQSGPLMLLLAPSVQKELKLKEEQKAKCYTFVQKANQKNRDMMQTRMFGGNANPQMVMEAARQLRQETDAGIAQILDPKQKERFDQIVLQNEGPLAVARPEIASKLRLNESQKEYVQGVMTQMRNELFMAVRQSQAAGSYNPGQVRELTAQLRKEAVKEISKVIDRKQQKNFNTMLGVPFDLAKLEAEAASAEAALAPAAEAAKPVDPAKPAEAAKLAETPQSKDAPPAATTEPDKATTKESTPPTSQKGSSGSQPGSNP